MLRRRGEAHAHFWIVNVVPAERHAIAREKIAQCVAGEIEAMSDQLDRRNRRFGGDLLQMPDARRHRAHHLVVEMLARSDQFAKIVRLDPAHARRLGGAEIRDRRRSQQQRNFACMVARQILVDLALDAADQFRHDKPSGQHDEKSRNFAFLDQPVVLAQINVRRARRDDAELTLRQAGEERHVLQNVGGDHAAPQATWL